MHVATTDPGRGLAFLGPATPIEVLGDICAPWCTLVRFNRVFFRRGVMHSGLMITAEELAHSLHTTGKTLRTWLRKLYPDREPGAPWVFTDAEAADLRVKWRERKTTRVVRFVPKEGGS